MENSEGKNRFGDIQIIREERGLLVKAAKELLILINTDDEELVKSDQGKSDKKRELEIKGKILEVSQHLANIGGFCDDKSRDLIKLINLQTLGIAMLESLGYIELNVVLPSIVGIVVDFNKRPFKIMGFDIKAFGGRIKATMKR